MNFLVWVRNTRNTLCTYISRIYVVWEVSGEASLIAIVKINKNEQDKENTTNSPIDAEDENGSISFD